MCGAGALGIQSDFIILLQKIEGEKKESQMPALRETRQPPAPTPMPSPACSLSLLQMEKVTSSADEKQPAWQSCASDDVGRSMPLSVGTVCYPAIGN